MFKRTNGFVCFGLQVAMESCCAKRHESQLEAVAAETRMLAGAGSGDPELDQLLEERDESVLFGSSHWERAKLAVWNLFEHPNTSRAAQVCTRASSCARSLVRTMCTSEERKQVGACGAGGGGRVGAVYFGGHCRPRAEHRVRAARRARTPDWKGGQPER